MAEILLKCPRSADLHDYFGKATWKLKRKINFYSVLNVRQDTGIDKSCKKIDLYSIMDIFKCDRLIIIEISAIQMSLCTSQIL